MSQTGPAHLRNLLRQRGPTHLRNALLLVSLIPLGDAFAHGYIENSRSKLCAERVNTNCGPIQYEPQSVEGPDRFPESGPRDGTIAAAGSPAWSQLNEQSASRWTKSPINAGQNTFHWTFTANHVTRDFRYFITRPGWNPNRPLARSQFDLQPFCSYDGNFAKPPKDLYHQCSVPSRQGYHVILAVWDVGDTANSFYSVVDVQFSGNNTDFGGGNNTPDQPDTSEPTTPEPPATGNDDFVDVGDIMPSMALSVGDTVRLRVFNELGEVPADLLEVTIQDEASGAADQWPLALARQVNNNSRDIRVGKRSSDSAPIRPARGANDVFARPSSGIVRTEIGFDITNPDTTPDTNPDTGTNPDPAPSDAARYPTNRGQYAEGTRVIGSDGNEYECLVAGWCNGSATYYAPGVGLAWTSAWQVTRNGASEAASAAFTYPDGRGDYDAGTIVTGSDGNSYRCKVPGWCNSSSEYYYAPGSGQASDAAWARL